MAPAAFTPRPPAGPTTGGPPAGARVLARWAGRGRP